MARLNSAAILLAVLLLCGQPRPGRAQPPAQAPAQPPALIATAAEPAASGQAPQPTRPDLPLEYPQGEGPFRADPKANESGRPSEKISLEKPPPPDSELERFLQLPPLEPGDRRYPINLATALRLTDARPVVVAVTGASVWVAEAELQKAKVLWLPSFNLATDFIRHDGFGPDLNRGVNVPQGENALGQNAPGSLGKPLNQNVNFLYSGAGVTYTPSTPSYFYQPEPNGPLLPSPQMEFLANMIFEPLRARQNLNAARWGIQTAKNDTLLQTAHAYFNVHRWRGNYAGAIDTVRKGRRLVREIANLTRDLIQASEIDRARNLLCDLEQQAVSARENWRVASAQLTQVLRLDPRAVVEPLERDHLQVTLIDPGRSLDDLIPIGLTNRPELAQHQAMVQATLVAIRREKLRPLLPSLLINGFQTPYELIEVGGYGVGNGGKLNNWSGRDDISPQAIWMAESMGFGNLADVKEQRALASRAIVEVFNVQDSVAGDVTRAQADVQSAAARVVQAERELRSALDNFNGAYEGLRQTSRFGNVLFQISRPQEVVFSLQLLKLAYDNYFNTVADYNIAQFDLFHALGYPAREIAFFRRAGEILPVDTARPIALPRVGTGPPPATR
jgi:hypothetical protein